MAEKDVLIRQLTYDNFVSEKLEVVDNYLLGFYDEYGRYFIPQNIVSELIEIEKVKKNSFGNSIFCIAEQIGYGKIVFEIEYGKNTIDNNATATLYLLENVIKINGYIQNTIRTKLYEFSESLIDFIEKSYEKFNIVVSFDGEEKGNKSFLNDEELSGYIVAKKQFSLSMQKSYGEDYEKLIGEFFESRMTLLKNCQNAYTNDILSRYQSEYDKIEKIFLSDGPDYKIKNQLLNKCFEDVDGKVIYKDFESEYKKQEEIIINDFVSKANRLEILATKSASENLKPVDKIKIEAMLNEIAANSQKSTSGMHEEQNLGKVTIAKQSVHRLSDKEIEDAIKDHKSVEPSKKPELDVIKSDFLKPTKESSAVERFRQSESVPKVQVTSNVVKPENVSSTKILKVEKKSADEIKKEIGRISNKQKQSVEPKHVEREFLGSRVDNKNIAQRLSSINGLAGKLGSVAISSQKTTTQKRFETPFKDIPTIAVKKENVQGGKGDGVPTEKMLKPIKTNTEYTKFKEFDDLLK